MYRIKDYASTRIPINPGWALILRNTRTGPWWRGTNTAGSTELKRTCAVIAESKPPKSECFVFLGTDRTTSSSGTVGSVHYPSWTMPGARWGLSFRDVSRLSSRGPWWVSLDWTSFNNDLIRSILCSQNQRHVRLKHVSLLETQLFISLCSPSFLSSTTISCSHVDWNHSRIPSPNQLLLWPLV